MNVPGSVLRDAASRNHQKIYECCRMASMARLCGYWRKRLCNALMAAGFVFLFYKGVVEMSRYTVTYKEVGPRTPLVSRELQAEGGEDQMKAVKGGLSGKESRQPQGPVKVLVVSSMPRSGSTLLTELLAAVEGSVVVFEPLWLTQKTPCNYNGTCVSKHLADVLSCDFKPEVEEWLKGDEFFFHYFSKEARRCQRTKPAKAKEACLKAMNLHERCEAASLVIVKVIRARLAWIRNLLEDSLINLKVIHLTRDPRGSLNSIALQGWDGNPRSHCCELQDDMETYEKLQPLFPSTVSQVRYETLCRRPVETTGDILRFLFDNATLPASVRYFLNVHMLSGGKKGDSMNTIKNSTSEFEAWRHNITAERLAEIEDVPMCVQVIRHMGHTVFGSYRNSTNSKIPLISST